MSLDGRVSVVTGGGRGIGAAVARALSAAGSAVVVTARSTSEIEAVARGIRDSGGVAHAVACDVSDPGAIGEMAREAVRLAGPVDVLVNNAGIATSSPFVKVTLDEWESVHRVNATGPLLCTQAFLSGMLERGWGRVVNVASIASHTGTKYITSYAASKHALMGMTRCLAAELVGTGVTVNAVCPGYVDTPMTEGNVQRIAGMTGRDPAEIRQGLEGMQPDGRFITAEEVAHGVMSFIADEAASCQGSSLVIDGGGLLR